MLINGQWAHDFQPRHESGEDGSFIRDEAKFRYWITPDGEAGPKGRLLLDISAQPLRDSSRSTPNALVDNHQSQQLKPRGEQS